MSFRTGIFFTFLLISLLIPLGSAAAEDAASSIGRPEGWWVFGG